MAASGGLRPQTVVSFDIHFWFAAQSQCLWDVDVRPTNRLSVDQTMKKVQHRGLGGDALGNGHFHGDPHRLFIMVQNQRQDLDHLPVTAWLALKDGQIMPPVVNRAWRELVASLNHPHMLTQDLTLRGDYQPVRINAQTGGTVRK